MNEQSLYKAPITLISLYFLFTMILIYLSIDSTTGIIALKASGRDYINNNELLHKIGVLQRYAMHLFVFTSEL